MTLFYSPRLIVYRLKCSSAGFAMIVRGRTVRSTVSFAGMMSLIILSSSPMANNGFLIVSSLPGQKTSGIILTNQTKYLQYLKPFSSNRRISHRHFIRSSKMPWVDYPFKKPFGRYLAQRREYPLFT